ncbi:hypothetical protein CF327_g5715 [Tilletia walkeri]|nr:hypothetical protein CF327_g5715 [Tilletia walkeri]
MPLPRNSLAGLDLDNLILTSRRGTAARNLPKDRAEPAETSPAIPAQALEPAASSSSRRNRVRTTSVAAPPSAPVLTPATSVAKAQVAPARGSPSRSSSRRSAAVAAAAASAETASEPPQSQAESSKAASSESTSALVPPTAQATPAPTINIRKIVLKRKRDEISSVQEEPKQPTPEPNPQRSKIRTRGRAESVLPPQASTSALPAAAITASDSKQTNGHAGATVKAPAGEDNDDEEDGEGDEDEDEGGADEEDNEQDNEDGDGEGQSDDDSDEDGDGAGDTTTAADGTVTQRKNSDRVKRPPKLDADGNPIPRKRGERGKRLKPSLREIEEGLKGLKNDDGGNYIDFFLELPSSTDYPDYYKHIAKPISLAEIDVLLKKKDTYPNPYSFVSDLRLMFANAKFYNEDGSPVWVAADALEKHLDAVLIPHLLSQGFTLDPTDMRKTVLPRKAREPKPPKPPKEKKITKAERRELERRAQAEEAARLAAEQAAAATGGMAALGEGLPVSMASVGMDTVSAMGLPGVPSFLAPPGVVQHQIPQMGYPAPTMPVHSSPYAASSHISLPQVLPQQHVQQSAGVFSPHAILSHATGQIVNAGPSPTGMQYHQHQHHLSHGASPVPSSTSGSGAVSGRGASYFPTPTMAAPAPPGALLPPNTLHEGHMGVPAHSSLIHPHPPMPTLSQSGTSESGTEGYGPALVVANALKAKESPGINPYSPPTVMGVRRPPVIPLVGVDVTLATSTQNESNKKSSLASNGPDAGKKFRKDLRVLVDNWVTHQHAITLPSDAQEVRIRFRTSPVTTKLHARREPLHTTVAGSAAVSLLTNGSAATSISPAEEDRKQRISWRWAIRTLVNGAAAMGEWKDEDEIIPPPKKKKQRKEKEKEAPPSGDAMDVDADSNSKLSSRRSAKGKTTAITAPNEHAAPSGGDTSAKVCTIRFRPQRGMNIVDVFVDSPAVPSARIERLLDQDEIKFDDEMRTKVLALKHMEEKYRLFIMVP